MKPSLAAALFLTLASPASAQMAAMDLPTIERGGEPMLLPMMVGQIQVLRTPRGFTDIIIGDPDIADARAVLTDRTVAINAKADGYTQFVFIDADKKVMGSVNVLVSNREVNAKHTIRVYAATPRTGITYAKPAVYYCSPESGCDPANANFDRKEPTTLLDRNPQVQFNNNTTNWNESSSGGQGGSGNSGSSSGAARSNAGGR